MSIRCQENKVKIRIRKRSRHIGNEDHKLLKPLRWKSLHTGSLGGDGEGTSISTEKETIKETTTRPVLKSKVHKNIFFSLLKRKILIIINDLNY